MDPYSKLYEVDQLDKEIKRLQVQIKDLRDRKNGFIQDVIRHMVENEIPEIEYSGKKFKVEPKVQRVRKKEKDRRKEAIEIITEHIDGPEIEDIYEKIKESFQGGTKTVYALKS